MIVGLEESELYELNECPYDQGGYFVINGSEKVFIAQERSAANTVQVFKKAGAGPVTHVAEIRSAVEKGSRMVSSMQIKMQRSSGGSTIKATLPYISHDIPIVIVFRALGVVSDRDVLEHICYDPDGLANVGNVKAMY